MNPVEIVALDALDLLVVVDNESDTLSSVDKGVPQLPELGRLVARVPHRAPIDGHDCVEPWGHLCLGCHGLSVILICYVSVRSSSVAPKHLILQPNAYQVLTKNLSDLAAVSKAALEHTVALLYAVFDISQRNKKCEACSYDLRGAKRWHVRGPDSREGRFTLVAPGVRSSTRNQWTG